MTNQTQKESSKLWIIRAVWSNALISLLNASWCASFSPSFKTDCEVSPPKSPASLEKIRPPVNMLGKRDFIFQQKNTIEHWHYLVIFFLQKYWDGIGLFLSNCSMVLPIRSRTSWSWVFFKQFLNQISSKLPTVQRGPINMPTKTEYWPINLRAPSTLMLDCHWT